MMIEATEGFEQSSDPVSRPEKKRIQVSLGLNWSHWWPAGFLLAGCIFGLTYMGAWSADTDSGVHLMFWAAIATIAITTTGLVASGPTRMSGFSASLALGVLLFLPKLFHSPGFFNYFDELSHWRAVEHLNAGAGLFLQNPINKAVEFFPGMEAATGTLVSTTGLSTFAAGNILIAALHALILGALFLLYERISGSSRIGMLSVVVFAASPAYVFFDSYFAYESFALPLAASALTAVVLSERASPRSARGLLAITITLSLAVVVSHHVTSWVLAGVLLLFGLASIWGRGWSAPFSKNLIAAGGIATAAIASWLAFVAPYTVEYVSPTFTESADAIARLANGSSEHRRLFYRSTAPLYEKYGSYLAVAILAVAFTIAVVRLVRMGALRRKYLTTALAIVGVTYFLSLPVAFLIANSAVNRVWDFAFLGVAPLVALALVPLFAAPSFGRRAFAALLVFVIFLGGVVSRTSLHQGLPGPYEPTADPRSMTADVFAASNWLLERHGADNVVTGDRAGFEVFGSYGDQDVISGQGSGARPWRIFFPHTITPTVLAELDRDRVHYLVIDRRIANQVPRVGWYYTASEPGSRTRNRPLDRESLEKFADSSRFSRIYDNGNILIYRYLPSRGTSFSQQGKS